MIRFLAVCTILTNFLSTIKSESQDFVPVIFREYGVQINSIEKLNDTVYYEKSSNESFKFVFRDHKGKCYCERIIKGNIYEQGNYENSLDTLKRYISTRKSTGKTSPITVQSFFEPLKNGIWITYKNKKELKETYVMGVLQ